MGRTLVDCGILWLHPIHAEISRSLASSEPSHRSEDILYERDQQSRLLGVHIQRNSCGDETSGWRHWGGRSRNADLAYLEKEIPAAIAQALDCGRSQPSPADPSKGRRRSPCYDGWLSGLGLRAMGGRKPRQVRKEATVAVRFVCRGLPGAWHLPAPCTKSSPANTGRNFFET